MELFFVCLAGGQGERARAVQLGGEERIPDSMTIL